MSADVTREIFNVGSSEEISVKKIVETILHLAHSNLKPEFNLSAQVPMTRRVGDSLKAKKVLGFSTSISFAEGLQQLIAAELLQSQS